ncbi:DsbA family protein [Aromatoleum diolicum]|uniref:Thioredoxin domain-containing protein n=1 Tax=Aromatoleum diolicum TaxID=75796 RepID=A0ABX1Q9G0_9RHOO|nr:thioredoxin domain-containing protein [Aromatoleum diolicum]NMG74142.1 thioredoxin domain-containing protein [Aromatoleum diolicum]
MNQKYLFGFAAALLMMVFVIATLVHNTEKGERLDDMVTQNRSALVRDHSPTLGAADARVHIVEFLDPACETCRSFYPFVKQMMAAAPGRIRVIVRYAPFHDGSDQLVKMLEAARMQGKFWETLEAMFASQPNWAAHHNPQPDLVWNYLDGVGLDMAKLKADMASSAVEAAVRQDLEDARALNVTKTPEFFVNGRPMPSFGYEQLQNLVQDELKAAY